MLPSLDAIRVPPKFFDDTFFRMRDTFSDLMITGSASFLTTSKMEGINFSIVDTVLGLKSFACEYKKYHLCINRVKKCFQFQAFLLFLFRKCYISYQTLFAAMFNKLVMLCCQIKIDQKLTS